MKKAPKRKPVRMPSLDVVTADFNAGMTILQMSEKYDVARSAVSEYLKRNNLSRRQPKFAPDDRMIVKCLEQGMTCAQIAQKMNASPDRVSRYVRANGLREGIERPVQVEQPKGLRPTSFKVINHYGVSIPRIPTIHGTWEARP